MQVDADVQPTYVRVSAKKQTLQLVLPTEVLTDSSNAARSGTTGHLLLTCPKMHPVVKSKAPAKKKDVQKLESKVATAGMLTAPKELTAEERLKGAVDVAGIVKDNPNSKARGEAAEAIKPTLGPDFDDEDEVPPLM